MINHNTPPPRLYYWFKRREAFDVRITHVHAKPAPLSPPALRPPSPAGANKHEWSFYTSRKMARQGAPLLAQTPEGRRKTRNRIVTALIVFAAIAMGTITSNVSLMSNSDIVSSSSSSMVRVLPSALQHVH